MYLTLCKDYFYAGFAFGEKAVKVAREAGLSGSLTSIIENAQKFAEGRAIRIEVRSANAEIAVKKLIAIKMAN